MHRLFLAELVRLRKSKVFWGCMIVMLGFGVYFPTVVLNSAGESMAHSPDSHVMMYLLFLLFVSAVFTAIFFGGEFSDGVIRNKLIAGHSRQAVYLSFLLVGILANLCLCLAYLGPYLLLSVLLLLPFETSMEVLVLCLVGTAVTGAAIAAMHLFLTMLLQSRSAAAVACLICAIGMLFAGIFLSSQVPPQTYTVYEEVEIQDETYELQPTRVPNPNYHDTPKTRLYWTLMEALPGGEAMVYFEHRYRDLTGTDVLRVILWAIGFCTLISSAGILLFRKRDIK